MLFPSFTFLLGFLPLTVIVYFLLTRWKGSAGRIWLIAASLVFYSWFNPSYGLILGGSVAGNWFFSRMLYRRKSLLLLWIGILCNVFWSDDPAETKQYLDMGIDVILSNNYLQIANTVKEWKRKIRDEK